MLSGISEGLRTLYKGKNITDKQITLFSIVGILSILTTYLCLALTDYFRIANFQIWIILSLQVIWLFYFTGYETNYLHNLFADKNILPEIDKNSFKITFHRLPFLIFLINANIILYSLITNREKIIYLFIAIISAIVTLFQAGYSIDYKNNDLFKVLKKLSLKDYFSLILKRVVITCLSFFVSYGIVFIALIIISLVILLTGYHNLKSFFDIIIAAQAAQLSLFKLLTYATCILFNYFLIIGNLAWDYDLVEIYKNRIK